MEADASSIGSARSWPGSHRVLDCFRPAAVVMRRHCTTAAGGSAKAWSCALTKRGQRFALVNVRKPTPRAHRALVSHDDREAIVRTTRGEEGPTPQYALTRRSIV